VISALIRKAHEAKTSGAVSTSTLARARIFLLQISPSSSARSADLMPWKLMDGSKLKALKWRPRIGLEEGLEEDTGRFSLLSRQVRVRTLPESLCLRRAEECMSGRHEFRAASPPNLLTHPRSSRESEKWEDNDIQYGATVQSSASPSDPSE
jgi:hypothetical protein